MAQRVMPSADSSQLGQLQIPLPIWSEDKSGILDLESTVESLSLCHFQVEAQIPGIQVTQIFEQDPLLPGVVVVEEGRMLGMLSRQRLLEYLIRPEGLELFLQRPLKVLYSYARVPHLVVSRRTPILAAARQALRRSPELQGEPLMVRMTPQTCCLLNVHELHVAYWQIRGLETQVRYERAQAQMIQSEKMANLGRLVDGVAHEILDPVGFIWGNLTHVSTYSQQLLELLAAYERHRIAHSSAEIAALQEEIELDYLREDLPRAIDSIRSGADRLKRLANSLQTFCHIDDVYPKPADLHECLDSILVLLKERLTGDVEVVRSYAPLPPVVCYAGHLSQVFMNILINAVDALINQSVSQQLALEFGDGRLNSPVVEPHQKPQIHISTQVRSLPSDEFSDGAPSRWVSICIADNGPGLSPEQHQRILESFSIKKRTEKETSLGLSYHIITAKHGGRLEVRSPRSKADGTFQQGTEFEILLPLN